LGRPVGQYPLDPQKRPNRCVAISVAMAHKLPHAPQHDRTVKSVTDLPIEAW
jgi:hypothetical protein